MGQSFSQKILARSSGKSNVEVGEIIDATPDLVLSHDNTAAIVATFQRIGCQRLDDPARHVIVLDHCVPAASSAHATNHQSIRQFVDEQGIEKFYDVERGVCHQVLPEEGLARPGMLILGADSHTTTHGALGAFAAGIGRSEVAAIMAIGRIWLRVPETIQIRVDGELPLGVTPKDFVLRLIGDVGADGALYQAVEFVGEAIGTMAVEDRLTLCNMTAEMGAKNGYVAADEVTEAWLAARGVTDYEPIRSDPDAAYAAQLRYDVRSLEPQVAAPHTVDNVRPVTELAGEPVDQALLGTCTNGRLGDLHQAAALLRGRRIHPRVRLLVYPASVQIYRAALADGTLLALSEAGAVIMNPGCGPCLGAHGGILAPGETCISTANRNFRGRMGSREASIYLGSPMTVAASALAGQIADPRAYGSTSVRQVPERSEPAPLERRLGQ
jgi:3-isopropylmalate/(R)-2-methylmalate dehydratase large subunit